MAGIGTLPSDPVGGIGAALIAGAAGYRGRKQELKEEALRDQEIARRREREDFAYNQAKDAALVEEDAALSELEDFINPEINPIRQAIAHFGLEPRGKGMAARGTLPIPGGSPVARDQHGPSKQASPEEEFDATKGALRSELLGIEGDYVKMQNRAEEDVARIRARTAGDPAAERRQLAAYKKNLDASIKGLRGKYDAIVARAAEQQRTEMGAQIADSMFRGDAKAFAEAGFVNEDGSPMPVVMEDGVPVGVRTAIGMLRLRSAVTWGLYKKGLATMKDFQQAMKEDQDSWDAMKKNATTEKVANIRVINSGDGGGKLPASIQLADAIADSAEKIRLMEKADPNDARLPRERKRLEALENESKKATPKVDLQVEREANDAVESALRQWKFDPKTPVKNQNRPDGAQVAKQYENLRDRYGKAYAETFKEGLLGVWSKDKARIESEMDAYWKHKGGAKKGLVATGASRDW